MKVISKLIVAAALMLAAGLSTSPASAESYYGPWSWRLSNGFYNSVMSLGDASDNTTRHFVGTPDACGAWGAGYQTMRSILSDSNRGSGRIHWWIDVDCGNTVRVCISNEWGRQACSTYEDRGWY